MQPFSWRSPLAQALDFLNKLFLPGVKYAYIQYVGVGPMTYLWLRSIKKMALRSIKKMALRFLCRKRIITKSGVFSFYPKVVSESNYWKIL